MWDISVWDVWGMERHLGNIITLYDHHRYAGCCSQEGQLQIKQAKMEALHGGHCSCLQTYARLSPWDVGFRSVGLEMLDVPICFEAEEQSEAGERTV